MSKPYKLKDYLLCLQGLPRLQPQSEKTYIRRLVEQDDAEARQRLEENYLPRVLSWVAPYRGLGSDLDELIEIGNRALLKGLRRYGVGTRMSLEDYLEEMVIDEIEAVLIVRH